MGFEIDFLPVGDKSRGGDAICLRFGNLHGRREEQAVVVIDGGYTETGENVIQHLDDYYGTKKIDIVLNTHPDNDHASGLRTVLRECEVGQLWLHRPANHNPNFSSLEVFQASANDNQRDSDRFKRTVASIQVADELAEIANERGIPIVEPFAGHEWHGPAGGTFRIVGPTVDYYESLLAEFGTSAGLGARMAAAAGAALDTLAQALLPESLYEETLTDGGETSARNNSSAISMLEFDGRFSLLTGDAGADALDQALDQVPNFSTGMFRCVQVPHHGSRRNVGPTVLDRLLGTKGTEESRGSAFVSVPNENSEHKHPSKKVTNAFRRRGYPVHSTKNPETGYHGVKRHHHDAPDRAGWTTSTALPLYTSVEPDGDDS